MTFTRDLLAAKAESSPAAPNVKLMRVRFGFELAQRDLSAFRGALVSHVGRDVDRFHNHAPGKDKFLYRYPLVQYRVEGRHAALLTIGEGVDDLRDVLNGPMPMLTINGRRVGMRVDDVQIDYHQPEVSSGLLSYEVRDYLPVNQENERPFLDMDAYAQGDYLSRLLTGHLLAFAGGIGWHIDERIRVELEAARMLRPVLYKGVKRVAFDVRFRCNLDLPPGIALGKSVAMGFGVTWPCRPLKYDRR